MNNNEFSHVDNNGKANMVDVGGKKDQLRIARAKGIITLSKETTELIKQNNIKKGDVLSIAQIAGIQAIKMTPNLIPLCHPINITKADVNVTLGENEVEVESIVKCIGKTGVEMEALTGVSIALLTIYDMCKAVDKNMVVREIKLIEKTKEDIK